MVIKHWPKGYSSYTVNLVWLQSSPREPWWLQYFKLVFIKILIVTVCSIFQNQIILTNVQLTAAHLCSLQLHKCVELTAVCSLQLCAACVQLTAVCSMCAAYSCVQHVCSLQLHKCAAYIQWCCFKNYCYAYVSLRNESLFM